MYYTLIALRSTRFQMKFLLLIAALTFAANVSRAAETCTTQSQMNPAERDTLAQAAASLAAKIQANDANGVRPLTIADFQKDFAPMANEIASTAPKLSGAQAQVEQLYILDASSLARTAAGTNPDAQFLCNLNQTPAEAEFAIPQLPPGKYAFAMVRMDSAAPWRLSFLLRQDSVGGQTQWLLAGLYPKPLTAAGHDGLWYWKQARALAGGKEAWNAWLYYQEAQVLLVPANFVGSTHLDKLQTELGAAVPSAISGGIGADTPLVVKSADGAEFRFTALTIQDYQGGDRIDVVAHIKVDSVSDNAAARKLNAAAINALVAAHPELRKAFHGVWVFADAPGQSPYATELAMDEIK
jgi:hypothetical protein